MRSTIYYILITFIILLFFHGCEKHENLPVDKLARMYVDILIAEQTYKFDSDSLQIVVDQVYEDHGITKTEYENEFRKFEADDKKWDEFFELAKTYLDSLKTGTRRPQF